VAPNLLKSNWVFTSAALIMTESKVMEVLFPGARRNGSKRDVRRTGSMVVAGRACRARGVQPGSLQAYLARLRSGGVIRRQNEADGVRFQPETHCPVFAELQGIVTKLTPAQASGETILVVEDTEATAQITRILLESWGYLVLEAHSPSEALDVSDKHADEIELLLTDVIMPGMSGPKLAVELHRRRPTLRVVFMSGYPADDLNGCGGAFLAKPFNPLSLSRIVRKTLDSASALSAH